MKDKIRLEVMKVFGQEEGDVDTVVNNIFLLFGVSNSVCLCRPNTDLYCETITKCNKCHKEVKTVRTN